MTKFGFFVFVVFIIAVATFIAFLFLDNRGEKPAEEPTVRTEEIADVRQP